ncbi:unnamed protein product [Ranitomeya imitator]|uniref:GIY-YIG domain-containing protein n=1 Tax=Ranitomeya imitator TaxID=111125 RepID=A0ABN9LNL8_9NEOB|nr:unnamed protein product [Ranitomeya imitator]
MLLFKHQSYRKPSVYSIVKKFKTGVEKKLQKKTTSQSPGPPCRGRRTSRSARKYRRSDDDQIADKGGAIVVQNHTDYVKEIRRQLSDTTTYLPIPHDPVLTIKSKIQQILSKYVALNNLDSRTVTFLVNQNPVTPVFYTLPKVHKSLTNPTGCPIVASTDSILAPISVFLEKILTPLTKKTQTFVLDTGHFLHSINQITSVSSDCILATFDVKSLYTSIEHTLGITAFAELLRSSNLSNNLTQLCLDLLSIVLRENYFLFGDQFYQQFSRIKRIVSDTSLIPTRLDEMAEKFKNRQYPQELLTKEKIRATEPLPTLPSAPSKERVTFIHTHHPIMPKIYNIIHKHWSILAKSYLNVEAFQTPALMCKLRPQNIRDSLVRADVGSFSRVPRQTFLGTERRGTFPCLSCACCSNIIKGDRITHPHTGKCYNTKGFYTCDTNYVVYLLKCPCGLLYVGETTQHLRDRIAGHKSTIRCKKTWLPVPHHFISANHNVSQLRVQVIEQVERPRRGGDHIRRLKEREAYWIYTLQTLAPKGLNRELDFTFKFTLKGQQNHKGTHTETRSEETCDASSQAVSSGRHM